MSDPEIVAPTLDRYEDYEVNQTHIPDADDITPEAMDKYICVEIMIYHGDTVAQVSAHVPILKFHFISLSIKNGISIGSTNGVSLHIALPSPNASLGHCITIRYHYLCPNISFYRLRSNFIHLTHVSLILLIIFMPIRSRCENLWVALKIFS